MPQPAKRPNILLITSDQHRPDCFGFAGRKIRTPYLDQLAADGTRFDCAITPNVLCQPARASILTGMLPLTHGVYDNQVHLDPAIGQRGWPARLTASGYDTAFIGKAHFGEDPRASEWGSPESREDSVNFPEDWHGPFMGFDYAELMILGHWHDLLPCEKPPHGQHFERWFWSHPDAWKKWGEDSQTGSSANYGTFASQTWSSALPAEWHSTHWVTERTKAYLAEHQSSDQPFCLWASYPDPHHPFDCPEPWASLHRAEDVDISRSHQLDLDQRPWWHRAALERKPQGKSEKHRILREQYSRMPAQSDAQLAEMTANYYNMIAFIDDGVGAILQQLESSGLADDTIVIFTSDHGELLGDHGLYLKGPMMYDKLLRVGMIMRGPGIKANAQIDDPISTMDLGATFCDWAQTQPDPDAQSQSLTPLLSGEANREWAYNEWNLAPARVGVELQLRTIRTADARLTVDLISGEGELYDLSSDPDEMHNLWNQPQASALQQQLLGYVEQRPGPIMEQLPEHTE
jgi:arylsulfatase A-like enzyme